MTNGDHDIFKINLLDRVQNTNNKLEWLILFVGLDTLYSHGAQFWEHIKFIFGWLYTLPIIVYQFCAGYLLPKFPGTLEIAPFYQFLVGYFIIATISLFVTYSCIYYFTKWENDNE